MSNQVKSVARLLGNSYAHLQHGIDRAIEWGFDQMAKQDKAPKKQRNTKTVSGRAAAVGKGILGFIGAAGEAYFRTYSDLKKRAK